MLTLAHALHIYNFVVECIHDALKKGSVNNLATVYDEEGNITKVSSQCTPREQRKDEEKNDDDDDDIDENGVSDASKESLRWK